MNFIQGKIVDHHEANLFLKDLENEILKTLKKPTLSPLVVIKACDQLVKTISEEEMLSFIGEIDIPKEQIEFYMKELRRSFSKEYLTSRLETEIGENFLHSYEKIPYGYDDIAKEQIYPLGVLLHIAAGNMDGLPIYTLIEGLLVGNINLLKLPSVDGGLTLFLLQKLCEIEPALIEYIYVFDISSKEQMALSKLMELSDGIVVWGGDEAIGAIRRIAPMNSKLIEWGHKISFAYLTPKGLQEELLEGLAHNICLTNQRLCSSCQGVFFDSENFKELESFCHIFLPILERIAQMYPDIPFGIKAQHTLQIQSKKLEKIYGETGKIFEGKHSQIFLERDQKLQLSLLYRNIWVKSLPRDCIVEKLHPYKNHLQTVGLLCGEREKTELQEKLWKAGAVRISSGEKMSRGYCGMPHDGDYSLRRYTKVVSAW